MAFNLDQLQALDDAIASGALSVTHNGRTVTYRSMRDLMMAREAVARALQPATPGVDPVGSTRHRLASFADD